MEKIKTSDGRILTEKQLKVLHRNGYDDEQIVTWTYEQTSKCIGRLLRNEYPNYFEKDYYKEKCNEMGFDIIEHI